MLRLFRFANQSEGDAYLHSHHPVYYLKALHGDAAPLPTPVYKGRHHARSVREGGLQAEFDVYNQTPGFQCEGFLILDSCTPTMHGTKGGGCVLGAKEDACRGGQDRVTKAASSATHPL